MGIYRRLLLSVGVLATFAGPAHADVGVIVAEPVNALGFFTRAGHAATYLSRICPDDSPIRMRVCLPGENGGVVVRSSRLSAHEEYDWAIVPFEQYMHGFASPDLAPLIGTRQLKNAVEAYDFSDLFSSALATTDGAPPEGRWRAELATRFVRSLYIFSVETTASEDAAIIAAFNAAPNQSRFNFFYQNCSDQTKRIFDLILPHVTGDRTSGLSMQTPKGLAKALVRNALVHPALNLRVRRYPQIPGTFRSSRGLLFPMENTYRNIAFAPYWYWTGFREVALASFFYHEVISPFDLLEASRDFMSDKTVSLTREQRRLSQLQDEISLALRTRQKDREWLRLSALDATVYRRLQQVAKEKETEVARVEGTQAQWRQLDREFRSIVRELNGRLALHEEMQRTFANVASNAGASRALLRLLEVEGEFYIDRSGPWLRLPLADGVWGASGVSRSQVLAGDPRVAVLVLAVAIDHNLSQSGSRREDFAYVQELVTLFRRASDTAIADPSCEHRKPDSKRRALSPTGTVCLHRPPSSSTSPRTIPSPSPRSA